MTRLVFALWRIEDKHRGAYNTLPSWPMRSCGIVAHLLCGGEQGRYLRLTGAEFCLAQVDLWMSSMLAEKLMRDEDCTGLLFHNGYRLFEGAPNGWKMCEGVFK